MVMAICGTFDYVFVVPEGPRTGSRDMRGTLREPIEGDQERLLGHAPLLQTVDYQRGTSDLHSRVTLTATDKKHARVSSYSFTVAWELIAMLRAGDEFHVSRTQCAGLGLSVLRGGELVAAAGAAMHVPLGPVVSVRHPWELARQAEEIFRSQDPKYEMRDYPVQLRVGDVTRIIHVGRSTIGVYEILVRHGFISGMPGTDECVSIERLGICPSTAAHNSAQLMEEETDDTRLER